MSHLGDWKPNAQLEVLRARGQLLAAIRAFFAARDVLEVDTQILSHAAVSDPFIDSIEVLYRSLPSGSSQTLFMQTSPEYAMKRLLAAGVGSIYQMAKVFRNGELGRRHNPEFTMLEWYRVGFDSEALMSEVEMLVQQILGLDHIERVSYRAIFQRELDIDPHSASLSELQQCVRSRIDAPFEDQRRDTWLELAMSELVEPRLTQPTFVFDFPASQAALAEVKVDDFGVEVAARFELYIAGMEIANGYQELTDAKEQSQRLEADINQRALLGLPQRPVETRLVDALAAGFPNCAGVALGVDRLLMLKVEASSIAEVLPFAFDRA